MGNCGKIHQNPGKYGTKILKIPEISTFSTELTELLIVQVHIRQEPRGADEGSFIPPP
jgi:hypothetical protein